jgi:hypothetical protein
VFQGVTLLNETSKELSRRSRQVNALALDAIVQSRRAGSGLRGFAEASTQMRGWTQELGSALAGLGELCGAVVVSTSVLHKEARLLAMLRETTTSVDSPRLRSAYEQHLARRAERTRELAATWQRAIKLTAKVEELGFMGIALARAAMIEACAGGPELRAQLHDVSHEFYDNAKVVNARIMDLVTALESSATHEENH